MPQNLILTISCKIIFLKHVTYLSTLVASSEVAEGVKVVRMRRPSTASTAWQHSVLRREKYDHEMIKNPPN